MYARRLDRIMALALRKYSLFEASELPLLERLIRKGSVVFEIGANTGYYTLKFAKWVGGEGIVYAFEPAPKNFRLLTKNISANDYSNVIAHEKAVCDKDCELKLYVSEDHAGDHKIYDAGNDRKAITVAAVSVDSFGEDNATPDVVKIDVQGAEYLVLKGMEKTIERTPAIVIISQFCPLLLTKAGSSPRAFLDFIKKAGLNIYLIDDAGDGIEPVTDSQLIAKCDRLFYVNILLTRLPMGELLPKPS